ncbi:hypothetical protein [Flavobacterium sp.]|uniref:hypothetical protein n=1 Tax=Flavobacterium sp. TaxID=239 RepID=UPI0012233550|nr:hypothetical protein [Flavobacterium sp.]RZJ72133.1 MAG: hypothetical protein EOO49_06685 [Flavobacterium sp.]
MKKLFLFLSASALFFGCSQDSDQNSVSKKSETKDSDSTSRGPGNPCVQFYTYAMNYAGPGAAAFTWDTSDAVYCATTTVTLEVIPFHNCTVSPPTMPQTQVNYAIPNFFSSATGSVSITSLGLNAKKCFKWRLVITGNCENNASCNTTTAWAYYTF